MLKLLLFLHIGLFKMFLFTKTAVIKSDLKQILLLMCFSAYLSNTFLCNIFIYTFIYRLYAQINLLVLWLNPLKRTRNHWILGLLVFNV